MCASSQTRLTRLYPLHLFMLFVILFMVITMRALAAHYGYVSIYDEPYHPINTWPTFVANLFLVQAWNMFPYLSWNGASWFVSVEFLLVPSDPALFRDLARRLASAVLLIVCGAAGWLICRLRWLMVSARLRNTDSISPSTTASCAACRISPSAWALPFCTARVKARGGAALPDVRAFAGAARGVRRSPLGDLRHGLGAPAARHLRRARHGAADLRAGLRPRRAGARAGRRRRC